MILDQIKNAKRYFEVHKGFKEAFEFILNHKPTTEEPQKLNINGTDLIAIIEPSNGKGRSGAKLEAHRKYIDIQYVIEGTDEIGWKPRQDCQTISQEYKDEKDIEFFSDIPLLWIPILTGYFAIFFPDDTHAPLAGKDSVRKIIMKIAV